MDSELEDDSENSAKLSQCFQITWKGWERELKSDI